LYFGLLISPCVLVFAISTVLLNHPGLVPAKAPPEATKVADSVDIPAGLEKLQGMERAQAIQAIMRRLGVSGEVNFIRYIPKENRMIVPVGVPGRETTLDLDLAARQVKIQSRNTGVRDALIYLHKSPGPHNVAVRGNWYFTRLWGWMADATAYLLLFITISGLYLWAVLKAERKIGLALLGAGAISFVTVIYAIAA
jgi:hypothetical protein